MKTLRCLSAKGPMLLLLSLVAVYISACYQANPNANVPTCLRDISRDFGVQWPTNYSDAHAGLLSIAARGVTQITALRMEVDKETLEQWGATATNTLEKLENWGSKKDPLVAERFPWWDIQSNTLTTHYGRKVDSTAISSRLDVDVVLLQSGRSVLYIESTVEKKGN